MSSTAAVAFSGLQASQIHLQASAHNLANAQTEGFRRLQVVQTVQTGGDVRAEVARSHLPSQGVEEDMVSQLQAKNAFLANLKVFKTNDAMLGTLLSARA